MKKTLLSLLLTMCSLMLFAQQNDVDLASEIKTLKNDLALHKREVALQISESKSSGDTNTWGLILAIGLAFLSGPVAVIVRSKLDKKRLEELATEKTRFEMEATFPPMAKKLMAEYLAKEVPARVNPVIGAAKQHEDELKLRQTTLILVIADTDEIAQMRVAHLSKLGYLNVQKSLPKKYEEILTYQIYFIEHPDREDSYSKLSNRYIQSLINDFSSHKSNQQGIFFYFSARCEGLDFSLLNAKGMCNTDSKIDENLMSLMKQLELNEK